MEEVAGHEPCGQKQSPYNDIVLDINPITDTSLIIYLYNYSLRIQGVENRFRDGKGGYIIAYLT
jgi:hypothetical protein